MIWFLVVGIALILGGVGYGLHRAALWAEDRGWVCYRNQRRPPAPRLGTLESTCRPEIEHVIEEASRRTTRADEYESGAGKSPETTADSAD